MSTVLYVVLAILLLGILVTGHELGHFTAARACGIEVKEFAVGMGPKLLSRKGKKSVFSLRALPFGGFCAFYGEDDPTDAAADDPRALNRQPAWKRLIVILAGPLMNFVLAYLVAVIAMSCFSGKPVSYRVLSMEETGAAIVCGVREGDTLSAVDGVSVMDGTGEALTRELSFRRENDTFLLEVIRDGEKVTLPITAAWNEDEGRYYIGILMTANVEPLSFGESLSYAADYCVELGGAIFDALKQLVTGAIGIDQMSGPVGVVQAVAQETASGGISAYLSLMVFISVNLGIMNLLPIPGLDGSRALFLILEIIRRKPVPPKKEAIVHLAGLAALMLFAVYITFQDVLKLFK